MERALKVFDSIFPKTCAACHRESDGLLCSVCFPSVTSWKGQGCQRCAENHGPFLKPASCPSCKQAHWYLKKVIAATLYEGAVRQMILRFKYGGQAKAYKNMASWLLPALSDSHFDCLVPVPTPFLRRMARAYNQAELLARHLSYLSQTPLIRALSCKWHVSQVFRKAKERRSLPSNYFRIKSKVQGQRIALIDDVFTTGGTANACAKILLDAGAEEVTALVIARRCKKI